MRINRTILEPELVKMIVRSTRQIEHALYYEIQDFCDDLQEFRDELIDTYHNQEFPNEAATQAQYTQLMSDLYESRMALRTVNRDNPLTNRIIAYVQSRLYSIILLEHTTPLNHAPSFEPLVERFQNIVDEYDAFKDHRVGAASAMSYLV
jgi:hypothetical protein